MCVNNYFWIYHHIFSFNWSLLRVSLSCVKNTIAVISFYSSVHLISYSEDFWKQLRIQIISFPLALVFDLCGETHVMLKRYASGYF